MIDVEVYALAGAGELEHVTSVGLDVERAEGTGTAYLRGVLKAQEEPPKHALSYRIAEAGESVDDSLESLVQLVRLHRAVETD